jgi:hypothetical protein
MNRKETNKLEREINQVQGLQVTGTRVYGKGSYALDVIDTTTGVPFVVNSPEAWEERLQTIKFNREVLNA